MLRFLKNFLWTLPFICFITGYFSLTKIYPVKEIETPRVIGKTLQDACTILAQNNLNSRLIALKEDPLLPHGTVISQTPQATQKIKPNQAVLIVASVQPEKTWADAYTTNPLNEVEQKVASKNIRAKTYPIPSVLPCNTCIAQWPEAGVTLEHNKMILYVSQPINKPIIIPNVKGKPILNVVDFFKSNSIEVAIIHGSNYQEEKHQCTNCTIIDQRPLAGSIMTINAQNPLRMQLHVQAQ